MRSAFWGLDSLGPTVPVTKRNMKESSRILRAVASWQDSTGRYRTDDDSIDTAILRSRWQKGIGCDAQTSKGIGALRPDVIEGTS